MSDDDERDTTGNGVQRWIRRAGTLIIAGLLVQALTLIWAHPTAFLFFVGVGGSLVGLGVLSYLWGLLRHGGRSDAVSG